MSMVIGDRRGVACQQLPSGRSGSRPTRRSQCSVRAQHLAWLAECTPDRNALIRSWKANLSGVRKRRGSEDLQKVQGTYASLA
jgi:hypothetical protein